MPGRTILLTAAAVGAALVLPSAAGAANSCRAHAARDTVVAQSSTAVVYSTGRPPNRYVSACTFKARKSFRLPGQDGGDTNSPYSFRLNGRFLAYAVINQEPASPIAVSSVYSSDLTKRRKLVDVYSGDPAQEQETSTEVKGLVVGSRGAVAWINESINLAERWSVHTAAPGGPPAILDRGGDIARRSLALGGDNRTLYWTRGGQPKTGSLARPSSSRPS